MADLEGKGFGTRAVHGAGPARPRHRRGGARRSRWPRPSRRRRSASTSATSTARSGNPTRTALETHLAALEGAAHGFAFASGPGRRGRAAAPARRRATTCCCPTTPTAAPSASPSRCTPPPASPSTPSTSPTSTRSRAAWTAGHPHGVDRDAEQPVAAHRRHRGGQRARPRARRHRRRRQHLRHPGAAAAARPRRRRRRALHHQVPRRPQRRGRRLRRHQRRRAGRAHRLPAERRRRGARARSTATSCTAAPRTLAAAHGAPQRERRRRSPSSSSPTRPSPRCSTRACPTHPGHDVAARQMSAFGGMVSIRLAGGEAAALEVCRRTELFTLAESLGAVESLIEHPGRMTHASVAGTTNEVPADLVRLSASASRTSTTSRRPRPGPRVTLRPPLDLLRPGRSIVGMSAILLPAPVVDRGGLGGLRGPRHPHGRGRAHAGREHGHRVRAPADAPSSEPRC